METTTKTPTAAQLRTNHERTIKAAAKLTDKAWAGIRYEAVIEEGKPGVIVRKTRPHNAPHDTPYTEDLRYTTQIGQAIGNPVTYRNRYSASNGGTMCYGVDRVEENQRHRRNAIQSQQRVVEQLRARLANAEADLAKLQAAEA